MGSSKYPVFDGCTALKEIYIGDNVKSIPSYAFYKCSSLDSVYISDMTAYLNIDFGNYTSCPMCHANKLYLNNNLVTSVDISNDVTTIPLCAFSGCSGLTSVTIPDSVTSIGSSAFEGCSAAAGKRITADACIAVVKELF